ncbi:hypothetical protein BD769DRAFT_1381778 [Suillus cothurnatus]|nr:hypothetical protein BD769DRAFT_1381778 [Suillus cothurnatus]
MPATTTAIPATTTARVTIRWETCEGDHTDALIQFLETHPANCCMLFNESKRMCDPVVSEPDPSGSQKGQVWAAIAKTIFAEDEEYKVMYAEDNRKFALAVSNRLTQNIALALHRPALASTHLMLPVQKIFEVSIDFPWYDALNALWKGNPSFAPKTILSAPGVDHAGGMAALTKGKGKQTAAPPPDSYDLVRDTENDVVNIVDDVMDLPPLTQGKGKERVPPLPSPDEPTASLDVNHSSHIPDVESPIHGTLFDNTDDNMEMQQWDGEGQYHTAASFQQAPLPIPFATPYICSSYPQ